MQCGAVETGILRADFIAKSFRMNCSFTTFPRELCRLEARSLSFKNFRLSTGKLCNIICVTFHESPTKGAIRDEFISLNDSSTRRVRSWMSLTPTVNASSPVRMVWFINGALFPSRNYNYSLFHHFMFLPLPHFLREHYSAFLCSFIARLRPSERRVLAQRGWTGMVADGVTLDVNFMSYDPPLWT